MKKVFFVSLIGALGLALSMAWAKDAAPPVIAANKDNVVHSAKPIEISSWRRKVSKAASVDEVLLLLRTLELNPVESAELKARCLPDSKFQRGAIKTDVFKARLIDATVEDTVVQVRGTLCGERVLFAVVLHPSPNGVRKVPLSFVEDSEHASFDFVEMPSSSRQWIIEKTAGSEYGDTWEGVTLWDFQKGGFVTVWSHFLKVSRANGGDLSEESSTWKFNSNSTCLNEIEVESRTIARGYVGRDTRDSDTTRSGTYCWRESNDGGLSAYEALSEN